MNSAKKEAKAEANRQFVVSKLAGREAEAKSLLQNKDAKYYSLKDASINYHDEGVKNGFKESHYEDYVIAPKDVDKTHQIEMVNELHRLVDSQRLTFTALIDNVLDREDDNYFAVLFWNAPEFKKATKQNGEPASGLSYRDERKGVKAISDLALTMNVLYSRDLVRLVMNEFPYPYRLVLFNNSKEIASNIHSQNKFKKGKKACN